jgi:hypothetical protein
MLNLQDVSRGGNQEIGCTFNYRFTKRAAVKDLDTRFRAISCVNYPA